jgi:hypothetical protein
MKKYLVDWENVTDRMVMTEEWNEWLYNLENELDYMRDEKLFKACKSLNFGQEYLGHAENTIRKNDEGDKCNLSLIRELKEIIKDQAAWMVFMKTLRVVTVTNRVGLIPKLAQAESDKRKNSIITREIKKRVIRGAISKIFNKYPKMPKTLSAVWIKFDIVNKDETFTSPRNEIQRFGKDVYRVKKGTDKKGEEVIIITKNKKKFSKPYAKRSLQKFIDELK